MTLMKLWRYMIAKIIDLIVEYFGRIISYANSNIRS